MEVFLAIAAIVAAGLFLGWSMRSYAQMHLDTEESLFISFFFKHGKD